jgi:hypothetical protein
VLTALAIGGLFVAALLALYLLAVLAGDPPPPETFDVDYNPEDYPCDTH